MLGETQIAAIREEVARDRGLLDQHQDLAVADQRSQVSDDARSVGLGGLLSLWTSSLGYRDLKGRANIGVLGAPANNPTEE